MVKGKASSKARLRASDIKDIETGLDTLCREKITIGAVITEQPDEAIFFLDQRGIVEEGERRKLKERGLLGGQPLKIDEILRPSSKIEAMGRKGKRHSSVGEKRLLERRLKAIQNRQEGKEKPKSNETISDIWMDEAPATKGRPAKKAAVAPAVQIPMAGASYRPTEEAHASLLEAAAQVEIRKMQEEEKLDKQFAPALFTGKVNSSAMDMAIREILAGNVFDEEIDNEEGTTEQQHKETPPVQMLSKKKSKLQRKREEKQKELKQRQKSKEANKKVKQELESLKSIAKQVRKETVGKQPKVDFAASKMQRSKLVVPAPIAFNLPEEISSSLRSVKTEGNLIVDRFKSFQERSLIEVSGLKKKTTAPTKKKFKMVERYNTNL